MKVLAVSSEVFPLIKTGGLADVSGSLPRALTSYGVETRTMLPFYPAIRERACEGERLIDLTVLGHAVTVLAANCEGLDLLLVDCPELYDRPGGPYVDDRGNDHADNYKRFAVLSNTAAQIAGGLLGDWVPDLIHTHDWQAALTSAYTQAMGIDVPAILTIHNLAFQGQYPTRLFPELELPPQMLSTDVLEYYGDICFLKAGIQTADVITTVSPTYSREILSDQLGMGLQGVLADRREDMRGIVNGIDLNIWNPATDPMIAANFTDGSLDERRINRDALLAEFGLRGRGGPVCSVVSRLTWQKGIDLLVKVLPGLVDLGCTLLVHGQGDQKIEAMLHQAAWRNPEAVAVRIGYEERLAHVMHAGSDIVIQPSRFEPCGLTQLYALRYGAIPIVGRTGGLAETIIDANDAALSAGVATGFQFAAGSVQDLYHAIERAVNMFKMPEAWHRLQVQGMKTDFSWDRSAAQYAALYQWLTRGRNQSSGRRLA